VDEVTPPPQGTHNPQTVRTIIWACAVVAAVVAGALGHEAHLADELARQKTAILHEVNTLFKVHQATPHRVTSRLINAHDNSTAAHSTQFKRLEDMLSSLQRDIKTLVNRRRPRRGRSP